LRTKVNNRFNVEIPKNVALNNAENVAKMLIDSIIKPVAGGGYKFLIICKQLQNNNAVLPINSVRCGERRAA